MTFEFHCSFGWRAAVNRRLVIKFSEIQLVSDDSSKNTWARLMPLGITDAWGALACFRISIRAITRSPHRHTPFTEGWSLNITLMLQHWVYSCSPYGHTGNQVISSSKCQRGGHHLMPVCKQTPSHEEPGEFRLCPTVTTTRKPIQSESIRTLLNSQLASNWPHLVISNTSIDVSTR